LAARRVNPQFFSILACRKYWLIAVSSPRRTSFRSCTTTGSDFMALPRARKGRHSAPPARAGQTIACSGRGDDLAVGDDERQVRAGVTLAELFAHFFQHTLRREDAGSALHADPELEGELVESVHAALDGFADLRLGDALTDANVHGLILMQMRIVRKFNLIAA